MCVSGGGRGQGRWRWCVVPVHVQGLQVRGEEPFAGWRHLAEACSKHRPPPTPPPPAPFPTCVLMKIFKTTAFHESWIVVPVPYWPFGAIFNLYFAELLVPMLSFSIKWKLFFFLPLRRIPDLFLTVWDQAEETFLLTSKNSRWWAECVTPSMWPAGPRVGDTFF